MSNALYDHARASFLSQSPSINMASDTIKAALLYTGGYTVDLVNHQYLSSVTGTGTIIATSSALSSITTTNGVFGAADITFTSVSSTNHVGGALLIYKDTGTASTSPLIAYIDTATGLPVTPNNSDITVHWSTSSTLIFSL